MANPFWIDSATIGDIADGDTALEAEVLAKGQILMVPKIREEVLQGNPFKKAVDGKTWETTPARAQACENVIKRMNIQLDMMGKTEDIRKNYEKEFKFKAPGKGTVVRAIEESDAIILSQVAASAKARNIQKPEFFTMDKRLVNNADAKLWKVAIITRTTTPKPPTPTGGGGVQGTFITLGPTPGKGMANAGLMVVLFQNVDFWLGYFNDKFQTEQVKIALNNTAATIRQWQLQNPTDGCLIALTFSRKVVSSEFVAKRVLIQPKDRFEYSDTFFSETPEKAAEAAEFASRQQRGIEGDVIDGPYTTVRRKQFMWITPNLNSTNQSTLNTPVGKWRVQVFRYTWIYEFDAQGGVQWTDPFNNMTGTGKWKIENGRLTTSWSPSITTEDWNFPLNPNNQTGNCYMKEGFFPLKAVKI